VCGRRARASVAPHHGAGPGRPGAERLLEDLPDVNLRLAKADVLDGRVVRLDYLGS